MGKFEAGSNPADHTVAEVNEFLNGGDVTGDEYDRVVQAEREGKNRVGIISGSGQEETAAAVAADEAAGPNERATGQESPADEAKTVDDPDASGDAGTTAEPYPDDAPAALGLEQPQSAAEEAAHAATLATAKAAQASDVNPLRMQPAAPQKTQTPEQALKLAVERSQLLGRATATADE
ncbi:hypothetical protein ABZX12_18565 [Kribbella sp. NPDC003505]|uniref:hypothetical protein n=1 Tax=Kribbella sp. NPDC003505 TaxID=3154448 RepID=UPI0033BCD2E3